MSELFETAIVEKRNVLNELRSNNMTVQAERKLRTKHLIEMGAAIYSVLGDEYHDGDKEKMIAFLKEQDRRGSYFSTAMGRPKKNNPQT